MPYSPGGGSAGSAHSIYRYPVKVGGANLSGNTISSTGTTNSEAFNPDGCTKIGLAITVSAVTGTTPTITPQLQWSPNGDASSPDWYSLPATANSQTQAAMTAITATGNFFEYWQVPVVEGRGRVRVVFDHTGSSTDTVLTFGDCYWVSQLI